MIDDACPGVRPWHVQHERPRWKPLVEVVGERLAGGFMWMQEAELPEGVRLHAYKHIHTRKYLYLTPDLRAFEPLACGRFAPLRLDFALQRVLCPWWVLRGWDAEDAEAIGEAIRRANARAAAGA